MSSVRRRIGRLAAVTAAAALVTGALAAQAAPATAGASPAPTVTTAGVSRAGSWLVDSSGRALVLHGVNIVHKTAPFYPDNFTAADAQLLASEGFNVARIGFIWQGVEPQPGVYDDAYIQKFVAFERLLGKYGIKTLVDFHQDLWSGTNGGGAPPWATLGLTFSDSFQAFWDDKPASDGVGIQTHYIRAWQHISKYLAGNTNIIGYDPFNEPQAGTLSACAPYAQCPQFESGALASFYGRFIQGIRQVGDRHVVMVEPIADNNLTPSALPVLADPQAGFTFHHYCQVTQLEPVYGPQDAACAPLNQLGLDTMTNYARSSLHVPALVGEWSGNDSTIDNTNMVDLMNTRFLSWSAWNYYAYPQDPANLPNQGFLVDDTKPGSQANAKQAKLDALAIPYATAIAGTPGSTSFDRTTRTFGLTYSPRAVPGASLTSKATTIFVPARVYPNGFHVSVTGGTYSVSGKVVTVTPTAGVSTVTVSIGL